MEVARSIVRGDASHIIFHPRLAERFDYDIQITDSSDIPELKHARKLSIRVQEGGNTLEFKERKSTDPALLVIPLRNIMTATAVTAQRNR
jgi:hypothetical protein